jgi:hypothetical protein
MKEMNYEQMGAVTGGSIAKVVGCSFASVLLVAGFAGLFALTAGASAVVIAAAATTVSLSPAAWGISCFTDY